MPIAQPIDKLERDTFLMLSVSMRWLEMKISLDRIDQMKLSTPQTINNYYFDLKQIHNLIYYFIRMGSEVIRGYSTQT